MRRAYTVDNWRYWAREITTMEGGKTLWELHEDGWLSTWHIWNILFAGIKTRRHHTKPIKESLLKLIRETPYVHMTNEEILQRDAYWDMVYPGRKDVSLIIEDKEEFGTMGDLRKYQEEDDDDDEF